MLKQKVAESTHDIEFTGFFGVINETSVRI